MRSNRTLQTIIQAVILVMLTAIVFKLPALTGRGDARGGADGAAAPPDTKAIERAYRIYFEEDPEISTKAELLSVEAKDFSIDGNMAEAMLQIEFKWKGHNPGLHAGPLKNAEGKQGDTVMYTEPFTYRHWSNRGWDIDARRERQVLR